MGGDGQVTLGNTVMKGDARKVRLIYEGKVLTGFAGGAADAFALLERFERRLEVANGRVRKAAVERRARLLDPTAFRGDAFLFDQQPLQRGRGGRFGGAQIG